MLFFPYEREDSELPLCPWGLELVKRPPGMVSLLAAMPPPPPPPQNRSPRTVFGNVSCRFRTPRTVIGRMVVAESCPPRPISVPLTISFGYYVGGAISAHKDLMVRMLTHYSSPGAAEEVGGVPLTI